MKHTYVSLGAACNAATMMKNTGLRKSSYPFDWLLNLESGLTAVIDIIEDDFEKVSAPDCYEITYHPEVGRQVPAYKSYPRTFHIHSDPAANPKIHEEMKRRFERLKLLLRSRDHLHFVYYRNLTASRSQTPNISPSAVAKLMMTEAEAFLKTVDPLRRGKTTLLLVLECDVEDVEQTRLAVNSARLGDERISLKHTISRYDDNPTLYERWQREWIDLILYHTVMPLWLRTRCRIKRGIRELRRTYKNRTNTAKK